MSQADLLIQVASRRSFLARSSSLTTIQQSAQRWCARWRRTATKGRSPRTRPRRWMHSTPGEFDVALVDVRMPGIQGPELITLLREKQVYIRVIIMTAFGETGSAVRSLRAGAFDFMEKPIKADVLLNVLTRAARRRRAVESTGLYRSSPP